MIAGLNDNPRRWTREDALRVREYCLANGGEKTEILPAVPGEYSPVWARIEDGRLIVWFFDGMCEHEHAFNFHKKDEASSMAPQQEQQEDAAV